MNKNQTEVTKGDILVVDDIPDNLRVLFTMLTEQGYEVRRVISGKQALNAVKTDPPDLILLDIKMPDMDGYEVCKQLKASEQTSSIPVIFLSALNEELDKVKAFAVGGADYITKPLQIEEVLARVKHQLSLWHMQRQLQAQNAVLEAAKQEAEAANRAKSEFLATMSHEIRTPLNAVISLTELLVETKLDSQQKEFVETIRQSGEALLTTINDILDLSKIESGKLELEKQPFNLRLCIEESLGILALKAAQKELELVYFIEPGTPARIVGDFFRLRQILVNLLSNAIKFTATGEVTVSATASPVIDTSEYLPQTTNNIDAPADSRRVQQITNNKYEIQFAVKDTGIGIPTERFDRLFQSFSQVDSSTTREYGGTGLGLVISRRLSEMMGGRIWVKSEVGQGSTFYFTIAATALKDTTETNLDATQPALAGKRLLAISYNAANRQLLKQQAQSWGMVVSVAQHGLNVLAELRQGESFDLAILDMQMPRGNGLNLAAQIHKQPGFQDLPLVRLAFKGDSSTDSQIDERHFAATLTKPIRQSQLYEVLTEVLVEQISPVQSDGSKTELIDPHLDFAPPLRILLAEDNVVNQKVALHLLKRIGYQADVANNGLEVLDALSRQSYDLVLMDVQMPMMDGLTATHCICQEWSSLQSQRPWIVALTANAMQGDQETCLEAGMDDYISKPIRLEELIRVLDNIRIQQAKPSVK